VDFLRRLEVDTRRAVLVAGVVMQESPDAGFPRLRAELTAELFANLDADDLDAGAGTGAAPAQPAPTPTASPSPAAS
jgi:hypothetical protein